MMQNNEADLGPKDGEIIGLLESPNRGDRLVAVEKLLDRPFDPNKDLSLVVIATMPAAARLRWEAMRGVVSRTRVRGVGETIK